MEAQTAPNLPLVGDVVCVSDSAGVTGLARKLQSKRAGPFRIVEVLPAVTVRIKNTQTGKQNTMNANRTRRCGAGKKYSCHDVTLEGVEGAGDVENRANAARV